ncbi:MULTISPECIES: hypothetical protein [unclassified Acinetobacter]|uniref:hypothetical protein n=1 Tax=unclassified Acinetobacter TaxID=196816 RepID=UPI0015D28C32|nr:MULTISPECIES: hypothetical protein [unclassified Acinetobacter]
MRSPKRLAEIRKLPCVRCGNSPPSEACHANWAEYGKSLGKKAPDEFTISLCRACHHALDTYQLGSREETKKLFEQWLVKTELMMSKRDEEYF